MAVESKEQQPQPDQWAKWRERITREARSFARAFNVRVAFFSGCAALLPDFTLPSARSQLYRLAGCDIARGVSLLGRITLIGQGDPASRLHIGEGCIIAPRVIFGLDAEITLGRNVSIGPGATLYTGTHAFGFGSRRMNPEISARPVVIEDGVWVGMQSLILPGVTLGQGSVVSAGAVVTANVPPNKLVAGNPAVVQQDLPFGNR